jgi:hypothetical protein
MQHRHLRILRRTLAAASVALWLAPGAQAAQLVGQWNFDEGYGTVAHDSSGYHDTGTLQNGPAWVDGASGDALSFSGNTADVAIPAASQLEPTSGVSVTAWVKGTSQGNFKYIMSKGASGCIAGSYGLYTGPNGGIMFYTGQNGGASFTRSADGGPGIWNGKWHFVAGVYNGSTEVLYVDGTQVGSPVTVTGGISYGFPPLSSGLGNDLMVGNYAGCSGLGFSGAIDQPSVWNGAMSESDVMNAMRCSNYGEPALIYVCIAGITIRL